MKLEDFFPELIKSKDEGEIDMEKATKLAIKKARLQRLEGTPKNIKCPGVTRKVAREVRNLSK